MVIGVAVRRLAGVALILFSACSFTKPLAPDAGFVSPRLRGFDGKTVAILPFDNVTDFLGADYLVSDEVNLQIGKTGRFRLVERMRVQELYREQDLDPRRMDDTTSARAGKLLGADAVVLGTVTRYKHANRPPEVPFDAFPVLLPIATDTDLLVFAIVNSVAAIVTLVTLRPPISEVGVSVRLVETETGRILWQARNDYRGDDELLVARRPREEWDRLRKDVVFLTAVLVRDLVATMSSDRSDTVTGTNTDPRD